MSPSQNALTTLIPSDGGGGGIDFAALRLCGVRFAGGMICSLKLTWQSNPLLRKDSRPTPPKRQLPNPGIPGWGVGGGGGIRTLGEFDPTPDFESGAIDHSTTPPSCGTRKLCDARRFVKRTISYNCSNSCLWIPPKPPFDRTATTSPGFASLFTWAMIAALSAR